MKKIIVENHWESDLQKTIPHEVHFENDHFVRVDIVQINRSFGERKAKPEYGISTGGYGVSTIEWHKDYQLLVNKAIEIAEEMNK